MPIQRIVLLVDISGENQNASCSQVVNPADVDNIKVDDSGVTRDFGNIIRTIKQAILISQGRDDEAAKVTE
jgi:citrate lyase gamma subunit